MKCLVYLEPHVIRDSGLQHQIHAVSFLNMIRRAKDDIVFGVEHDIRILCTPQIAVNMAVKFSDLLPLVITPSASEQEAIYSKAKDWNTGGIEDWCALIRGEEHMREPYQSMLSRIRAYEFGFDYILVWGNNGVVRNYARERGIDFAAVEFGCVRKPFFPSIIVDPEGCNGEAFLRKVPLDALANIVPDERCLPPILHKLSDCYYNSYVMGEEEKDAPVAECIRPEAKRLLIPMQLAEDSNSLLYSGFTSPLEFLQFVVPKAVAAGWTCLVKPHPGAEKGQYYNRTNNRLCREWCATQDGVVWVDGVKGRDNLVMLNMADAVVTVNSSVGFEALMLDKPTCLMGDAVYDFGNSLLKLDELLNGTYDKNKYAMTMQLIREYMLSVSLQDKPQFFEWKQFCERLAFMAEAYRAYSDRPAKWAEAMYHRFGIERRKVLQNAFVSSETLMGRFVSDLMTAVVTKDYSGIWLDDETGRVESEITSLVPSTNSCIAYLDQKRVIVKKDADPPTAKLHVAGWAMHAADYSPVKAVLVFVDGALHSVIHEFLVRNDLHEHWQMAETYQLGFNLTVDVDPNMARKNIEVMLLTRHNSVCRVDAA